MPYQDYSFKLVVMIAFLICLPRDHILFNNIYGIRFFLCTLFQIKPSFSSSTVTGFLNLPCPSRTSSLSEEVVMWMGWTGASHTKRPQIFIVLNQGLAGFFEQMLLCVFYIFGGFKNSEMFVFHNFNHFLLTRFTLFLTLSIWKNLPLK